MKALNSRSLNTPLFADQLRSGEISASKWFDIPILKVLLSSYNCISSPRLSASLRLYYNFIVDRIVVDLPHAARLNYNLISLARSTS